MHVRMLGVLLAVVCLTYLRAQQPGGPPQVFRASVNIIQLDVSVLDRARRPVRGLTSSDFTLFDNGHPVDISAFTAVDLPSADPGLAGWVRTLGADVASNELDAERIVVILLDDFNIPYDPSAVAMTKHIADDLIDRLGPEDLAAVVYVFNRKNGQEFTKDHGRLHAAVSRFTSSRLFAESGGGACPRNTCVSEAFQNAARSVLDLPGRRKAFVFISDPSRSPFDFDARTLDDFSSDLPKMLGDAEQAFDLLRRANVDVYAFSPLGLTTTRSPASALQMFADNTGGWSVVDTNEPWKETAQVIEENGSYYILGFEAQGADTRFHKLSVRVNRPDVVVKARSGYFAAGASVAAAKPSGQSPLEGALPSASVPLKLQTVPLAIGQPGKAVVAAVVGLDTDVPLRGWVDMTVVALDDDWKVAGQESHRFDIQAVDGRAHYHYDLPARLELKPGRYEVRAMAKVVSMGKTGSVYGSLDVPDFSGELTISAPLLERQPATTNVFLGDLSQWIPFQPTTVRIFRAGQRVRAFTRIWQAARRPPVSVTVVSRIIDAHGRRVAEDQSVLDAKAFGGGRNAAYVRDLPVSALPQGDYLWSIEATATRTSRQRDVRFTVE